MHMDRWARFSRIGPSGPEPTRPSGTLCWTQVARKQESSSIPRIERLTSSSQSLYNRCISHIGDRADGGSASSITVLHLSGHPPAISLSSITHCVFVQRRFVAKCPGCGGCRGRRRLGAGLVTSRVEGSSRRSTECDRTRVYLGKSGSERDSGGQRGMQNYRYTYCPYHPGKTLSELTHLARDGDRSAESDVIWLCKERFMRNYRRKILNTTEREEVCHDSLMSAIRALRGGLGNYDTNRSFLPFYDAIAYNHFLRWLQNHRPVPTDPNTFEISIASPLPDHADRGVEDDARTLRQKIDDCLDEALTPLQREYIRLRLHKLGNRQIAELLTIPIGTVMNRGHGARNSLRRCLEDKGVDETNFTDWFWDNE